MSSSLPSGEIRVGFDVGGTFTDFVLTLPTGELITDKRLSSPDDPVRAIREGLEALLEKADLDGAAVGRLIHATTRGSNAVLERRGPKVALITTAGFRDVLHIQRSLRSRMYDVQIEKRPPLIPRSQVFEVGERMLADGSVLRALPETEVERLAGTLRRGSYQAIAVAFMHAYANPEHEIRTREILQRELPDLHVTISSEVSLQGREYERTNTATVNAYLAPVLGDYVHALRTVLPELGITAPLWMMQSSGGLVPAEQVVTLPVRTIESGPAAGALMAAHHGALAGSKNVLSFDMGGTSAKVAVIEDGRPSISRSFELERQEMRKGSGLPLDIPAVDLVEVGTGGGSIAYSEHGVLKVGPRSAGADPGPACYGRGGSNPTVTDANLLLGYLDAEYFAGGAFRLQRPAAEAAVDRLATLLGLDRMRTAWGIHEVATLEMERALRLLSIDRGLDPRDFLMVCFGGAAPAHGSRLARALGVRTMIVPPAAGVGSALGLLEANESVELARTAITRFDDDDARADAQKIFVALEAEARRLTADAWHDRPATVRRAVGMRFVGQGYELEVPADGDLPAIVAGFHDRYERTYGYREDLPVEAVTWYLTLQRDRDPVAAAVEHDGHLPGPEPKGARAAFFPESGLTSTPVYDRSAFFPGQRVEGPCFVEEEHTTTVVLPGDSLAPNAQGALVLTVGEIDES